MREKRTSQQEGSPMETPMPPVPSPSTYSLEFVDGTDLRSHVVRYLNEFSTNLLLPEGAENQENQFQYNNQVQVRINDVEVSLALFGVHIGDDIFGNSENRCKIQLACWEDGIMEWLMWVELDLRTLQVFDYETLPPIN